MRIPGMKTVGMSVLMESIGSSLQKKHEIGIVRRNYYEIDKITKGIMGIR